MLDIIRFLGGTIVLLYDTFDVKLFPDMPISLSQLFLGLIVLATLFKILFSFSNIFGRSDSFFTYTDSFGKDRLNKYQPRHEFNYKPKHARSDD